MRGASRVADPIHTNGDGRDVERITAALRAGQPEVVVAAGGDGTVGAVVQAMIDAGTAAMPALAIVPIGTANNLARSLGLLSVRRHGMAGVEVALQALAGGRERRIDLGTANGRCFVGALGAGMDADILAARNRWRRMLHMQGSKTGYSLYLLSCAVNLLRPHGTEASLALDGSPPRRVRRIYNLLVLNVPLYAGEFRFAAPDTSDAGRLDLHLFDGAADYLRRYPEAWRRHVRHGRGEQVLPPRRIEHFADLVVETAAKLAWQLDGEEMAPTDRLHVRVIPGGLRVLVPPSGALRQPSRLG